jgi:protoheme ferro-lyase
MPGSSSSLKMYSIRLHRQDVETIRQFYPNTGYNEAIRHLLHEHCNKLRRKERELTHAQRSDHGSLPGDIDLDAL